MKAEDQRREWRFALLSPEGRHDPLGMAAMAYEVMAGHITLDTRAPMPTQKTPVKPVVQNGLTERQQAIIKLAEQGPITSGLCVREIGWGGPETMRQELVKLARAGYLRREGEASGTRYFMSRKDK
jgi:hypothetical protein